VLDQRDGANVFLAEILRAILKEPGQSKLPKKMLIAAIEEADRRANSLSAEPAAITNSAVAKQVQELRSIKEHIEDAKRHVAKSAVQYKNVIRVILGEEPQKPRKDSEHDQLFPPKRHVPAALKMKPAKSAAKRAPAKGASKTTGERAIAAARKRMHDSYLNGWTPREKPEYLELTEIETFILTAASSVGIPVWTEDFDSAFAAAASAPASVSSKLTWEAFGEHVVTLAEKDFDAAKEVLEKALETHRKVFDTTMESNAEDHLDRGVAQSTYDAAQHTYSEKEDVARQALDYKCEPQVLAKKAIMLLAKIRDHMTPVLSSALTVRSDNGLGTKVVSWHSKEILRWATSLDLLDNNGKALAFTALDFYNDLPESERSVIEVASVLNKKGCRQVASQIALMSRLRSLFVRYKSGNLSEKIEKASKTIRTSGEKWENEPKTWSSLHDVVLLNRLVDGGLTDVFMRGTCTFIDGNNEIPAFSSHGFHLTKGALQQRANVLARELHAAEESSRILEERRNAALPAATAASVAAATKPRQQQMGLHSFFSSSSSSSKPENAQNQVLIDLLNSDTEGEDSVAASPDGKRKSSDSQSSEKKPRTS